MQIIYFVTMIILLICLVMVVVIGLSQLIFNQQKNKIGFLPSLIPDLDSLVSPVLVDWQVSCSQYVLYEPGCGLATTSYYLQQKLGFKKVVGVEAEFWTYQGARLVNWLFKHQIELVKADVLEYKVCEPKVVIAYLGNQIITKMKEVGALENSVVISITFSIDGYPADRVLKIGGFYKQIYMYDFRLA